eukprot:TRINITY_DN18487_c0_g1_i1.p1 TRINITY_DN18487_c0_g1~~TRINITY_DN18487_c0_g1_i1.p1  ORF type:complete len:650 (+),score=152.54 TRINITY_DN18487_c0_g1_i1:23-1972(+)
MNQTLAAALYSWMEYAAEMAWQRQLLKRSILSLVSNRMFAALYMWRQFAADRAELMERLAVAMAQWQNQHLSRAVRTLEWHAARARQAAVALMKMRNIALLKAVNKWVAVNKSEARNQHELLGFSVRHWLHMELGRSLLVWRIHTEVVLCTQDLMWRAAQRWLHRNMNDGFVTWMSQLSLANIKLRTLKKWQLNQVNRALLCWRRNVDWINSAKMRAYLVHSRQLTRTSLLAWRAHISTRAVGKHLFAFGKQSWEVNQGRHVMLALAAKLHAKQLTALRMEKASQHHTTRQSMCTLDRLEAMVYETYQAQAQNQRAMYHGQLASVRRLFGCWHGFTVHYRRYVESMQRRVVQHLTNYFLMVGVQRLGELVATRRRESKNQRRAGAHWLYATQWDTMEHWAESARQLKKYRARTQRIQTRAEKTAIESWNTRQLDLATWQWTEFARESAAAKALVGEGKACYLLRVQSQVVGEWRTKSDFWLYVQGLGARAELWWRNKTVAEAFVSWQQDMVDALDAAQAHKQAVVHRIERYLLWGLHSWALRSQEWLAEARHAERADAAGASHWNLQSLARGMNQLLLHSEEQAKMRQLDSQARHQHEELVLAQALQVWAEHVSLVGLAQMEWREAILHWALMEPVSYTHLTLPTKRIV